MDIGEVVRYGRRQFRIRGFDPHSVVPRRVYLEDVETGKQLTVTLPEPDNEPERGRHLRLVKPESE